MIVKKAVIILTIAVSMIFLGITYIYAEGQQKMTILYKDGKKQVIYLDESSCNILTIDFSTQGMAADPRKQYTDTSKQYTDTRGNRVAVPCGKLAFTDRVVAYNIGNPAPTDRRAMNPNSALGEPDYISEEDNYKRPVFSDVTLGCGGSITLEFTRVRLVDVQGPDLYIFETGPAVEPTMVEISKDGVNWISVGRVSGGKASLDIHNYVSPNDQFRFVRLTDLRSGCGGNFPGADIDAVAAIGCITIQ